MTFRAILAAGLLAAAAPLAAQPAPPPAQARPPKLIVAISVDQLSSDLFAQYRNRYADGMRRMTDGVVFASGYQSHAATETCPGHSTILTGMRPARTGIVANQWVDQRAVRADKVIYCAEDESAAGSSHDAYTPSAIHLKVPTLGEMMKARDARSRVVAVAGKDRAAIMMGGHKVDELWFWKDKAFVSVADRKAPETIVRANEQVAKLLARPQGSMPLPDWCAPLAQSIRVGEQTLGAGRFEREAGDARSFRASPAIDAATLGIAIGLVNEMKLGRSAAPDLIAIGLSATDYVGHAYGTQGSEMCINVAELDRVLGAFFQAMDATGVDYQVVLTADHGAHDMTERQLQRAMPMEAHVDPAIAAKAVGAALGKRLGIAGPVLIGPEVDIYVADSVPPARRREVLDEAAKVYRAMPQVQAVLTRDAIAATPMPTTPPETWTLLERARASFDAARSGDFLVILRPRVTTIPAPGPGYVETHGSPWDYDRRVPILFWRKGTPGFEQPLSVETVDIAPTLAGVLRLPVSGMDGRCLDLDAGEGDTCK